MREAIAEPLADLSDDPLPKLALFRRGRSTRLCLLLGAEPTYRRDRAASASDPNRTSVVLQIYFFWPAQTSSKFRACTATLLGTL